MGYASNIKAYRLLNSKSNVIVESRNVEFFKNVLTIGNSQNETHVDIHASRKSQVNISTRVVELASEPWRNKRVKNENGLGLDKIDFQLIFLYLVEGDRKDVVKTIPFVFQVESNPRT